MNVSDFLDHAAEPGLTADSSGRSAGSRAYYAAYHAAVDFLFQVGVRTPTGGTGHAAAFNALIAIDGVDEPARDAGSDLMTLHGKRHRTDYRWDLISMEQQDQAQDLVNSAREIVAVLTECLADQDRADAV